MSAEYKVFQDFNISVAYHYSKIIDEDATRTPGYLLGTKNNFSLVVNYRTIK